jgi:DNA-binding transcriptional regulator YiaG
MANAIHRKTGTAQRLERIEKEMTRLKGRVEELRRSFMDATAGNGKVSRPEAIRQFCREVNITIDTFTRLVGTSRRTVATWLAGDPPNRANQRNVSEMFRLFEALAEVVPASQIGPWLDIPNPAFEGSTPLQVIERGESDRLWRMIWELRMGNSGD